VAVHISKAAGALWRNWTLKAEYLYVNLGGNTLNENVIPQAIPVIGVTNTSSFAVHFNDVAFNVVRAGLNWKF
jgi:outer membrane immunogenic protein